MKKLVFTSFTLFALLGFVSAPVAAHAQVKKPKPQPAAAPVPTCPANDPNGCGIFN
jgi:methionine-rich copper-binding protein CopC